ncbi:MAG: ATP-binding cassette domain-containing protein [Melioribacteraceae bacterium]|nr:ATP-binding cassette domain-containing protein [Melioribacteraceae bacterium]
MIIAENIYKSFESNQVLRGVNLKITKGESIAIIGQSGCGKSVFLKLLLGLLIPDKGSVSINGTKISSLSEKDLYQLRRRFGFLFQGAALFDSLTVAENIGLPLVENNVSLAESKLSSLIAEKLDLVGLRGIEELKPSELSGGMKKRVGLARALITEPEFILYDEPTTGLDPISSDVIDDLIKNLSNNLNVTSIVVTHDMFTVKNVVKKVAMMHEGKIYFTGSSEELVKSKDPIITNFIKRTEV